MLHVFLPRTLRTAMLLASFSILAACGGSDDPVTTSPPPPPPPPPPVVVPVVVLPSCPDTTATLTAINAIQGLGLVSPLVGNSVAARGVVTGDFQNTTQLSGFFMQQAVPDADPETSEGIFVFAPGGTNVAVGDYVQVLGSVTEFGGSGITATNSITQLSSVTSVTICGTTTLPEPIALSLPVTTSTSLEKYEGMLVKFADTLSVTEVFGLGRFGEIALSAGGRQFNPTNGNSTATSVQNQLSRIILDDASSRQNPSPTPYLSAADTTGTRRVGDAVQNLTGILSYGFNAYRLQPTIAPVFTATNPRNATPPAVAGTLKVASFNVLNYFTTLGSRGANSPEEFTRQRAKIVEAIVAIDADVLGLTEIENNGNVAINDLVAAINTRIGTTTYAPLLAGNVGGDQIKVDAIYKPARVQKLGNPVLPTGADLLPFSGSNSNRPPLAQRFAALSNNGGFWFVINHFKSKGSCPTSGDIDAGQGCWNLLRTQQANALNGFVASLRTSSGENDVLMMGDFNSYLREDPVQALTAAGNESLLERLPAAMRYSYVFNGETGALDQAHASNSLKAQVTGVNVWHINSDEPIVLDYNTELKTDDRYAATPFRASDHDPVIVGLTLTADAPVLSASLSADVPTQAIASAVTTVTNIVSMPSASAAFGSLQINWGDATAPSVFTTSPSSATHTFVAAGTYTVVLTFTDSANAATSKSSVVKVTPAAVSGAAELFFSEYVEGSSNNKALEIYNPTAASIDLSSYAIQIFPNGTTTVGAIYTLTGTMAPGAVSVVANASATATLVAKATLVVSGIGVVSFNGDDALTLTKNGIIVDRIGQVGFRPTAPSAWVSGAVSTLDKTLRRKPSVKSGDTATSSLFDPALQWDVFSIDDFSGLGSHTVNP